MLKANKLSKVYEDFHNRINLFSCLDFEAKASEMTVIYGPSGSGKSSLLKILSSIDEDYKGQLEILGENISKMNEAQRATFRLHKIGFIFQSFDLIEEFTLLQNCMVPLQLQGLSNKQAQAKANDLLEKFLPDVNTKSFPYQLSGGEQQRASIVRALIHEPSIIIADEPTGNLDIENAQKVRDILEVLAYEKGMCVVIVTHESVYEEMADSLYRFEPYNAQIKSKLVKVK